MEKNIENIFAVMKLLASLIAVAAGHECDHGWSEVAGMCLKVTCDVSFNWQEARVSWVSLILMYWPSNYGRFYFFNIRDYAG